MTLPHVAARLQEKKEKACLVFAQILALCMRCIFLLPNYFLWRSFSFYNLQLQVPCNTLSNAFQSLSGASLSTHVDWRSRGTTRDRAALWARKLLFFILTLHHCWMHSQPGREKLSSWYQISGTATIHVRTHFVVQRSTSWSHELKIQLRASITQYFEAEASSSHNALSVSSWLWMR